MVSRVQQAQQAGRRCVMILPNPAPLYQHVARLINALQIDCSHLYCFAMDEYADQDGRIAPPDWPHGFVRAMHYHFYEQLDPALRPPKVQFVGPTDDNVDHYGQLIEDLGGADICYTGPGWTGHLAFIEPDAPEFDAPLEQWKQLGTRRVTLSPFTLAQNSMHGSFGKSGDLAAVPPRAATIGPAEVIAAHHRLELAALTVHGTSTSWQRMIARLCYHGPVTPKLPTSIHQTLRTDCYLSETVAQAIEPDWEKGY
jgi:glucosamine-6-phosphate deaminase